MRVKVVTLNAMPKSVEPTYKKATTSIKNSERKPYLTKRLLVSAAKRAGRIAAKETMEIMGYNVIAQNGWVVKKYADGTIEKIEPIDP